MPTPHYRARPITRGSTRKGKVRRRKGGGSAARKLAYIERGGAHAARAHDVLALGLAGPDLGDWLLVDRCELRRDALVAREIICAIPIALSLAVQTKIAKRHARRIRRLTGCAVRWALHRAGDGDERNTHLHFLITPRRISDRGEFAPSKATAFDLKKGGRALIAGLRAHWQDAINFALAHAGRSERLDLRTLRAQGLSREAQVRVPMHEYERARRDERAGRKIRSRQYARNRLLQAQREAADTAAQANAEVALLRAELLRRRLARRRFVAANRVALAACRRVCDGGDRPPLLGGPSGHPHGALPTGRLRDHLARPGRPGAGDHAEVDGRNSLPLRSPPPHGGEHADAGAAGGAHADDLDGAAAGHRTDSTGPLPVDATLRRNTGIRGEMGGSPQDPQTGMAGLFGQLDPSGRDGAARIAGGNPHGRAGTGLRGHEDDPGTSPRPGGRAWEDHRRGTGRRGRAHPRPAGGDGRAGRGAGPELGVGPELSEGNASDGPRTLPPADAPATFPDSTALRGAEADDDTPQEPTRESAVESGDLVADGAGYIIEIRGPTHQPGDRTFHMRAEEWERVCAADPLPLEVELCTPAGEPVDPASGAKRTLRLSTVERCVLSWVPVQQETPAEAPREETGSQPAVKPKPGRGGRK